MFTPGKPLAVVNKKYYIKDSSAHKKFIYFTTLLLLILLFDITLHKGFLEIVVLHSISLRFQ